MGNIVGSIAVGIVDKAVVGVALTEKTQGGLVSVVLESTSLVALQAKVAEYYTDYPPMGYSTFFRYKAFDEEKKTWSMSGSRFSSCD